MTPCGRKYSLRLLKSWGEREEDDGDRCQRQHSLEWIVEVAGPTMKVSRL